MSGLTASILAHVASGLNWPLTYVVLVGALGLFVLGLACEHLHVKHGELSLRELRKPIAALIALALAAVVAPTPGLAQSSIGPMGLPDLVSDPPFIWIESDRTHPVDGQIMRVIAFDGLLHNIGGGALDLAGNPQVEGGVKQRVFDGENWEDVGEPLVRFETDDGHNHFHLMNAAAYSLWNEGQDTQVAPGAKVGFCLLDTMQIERGVEAAYLLDEINYCNIDEPESTDLRMGISPGWVDIYEASLTFQWVDVSNVLPGRYWVGAEIDPTNQIVESNEDNNGLVFSSNKYAVSGFNARELPAQKPGEIQLKSDQYGTTGRRAFVIAQPPQHGTLSVPVGFDLLGDTVIYTPNPGFDGADSFEYYAHDTNTPFPYDPQVVRVEIQVGDAQDLALTDTGEPPDFAIEVPGSDISASRYETIALSAAVDNIGDDDAVVFYAKDLPPGLTLDPSTGLISGELTMPGEFASTIVARVDGVEAAAQVVWKIADTDRPSLRRVNDISTILGRRDIVIGAGTAATTYRADGLPDGMVLTAGQPSILGTPTEIGSFNITVEELVDDEVVDTVEFVLTVRPAATPGFVL